MTHTAQGPLRLFLDTGVLVDGFFNPWGTCKGVLILATLREQFHIVLAESVLDELSRTITKKSATLPSEEQQILRDAIDRWTTIAHPKIVGWPSETEMYEYRHLLSAVRHRNDMPSVVAAVLARPDWVLSTNTEHWNQELAARTGLRITTPLRFLASLEPRADARP